MRRQVTRQPILLVLAAALFSVISTARGDTLVYNFEQAGTGAVLAQLELSMLPATHEEVVNLTFTSAGQELFGYNFAVYPGTFATTCIPFIDDGMGGLTGSDYCFTESPYIQSHDPPQSSLSPIPTRSFHMTAFDQDMLVMWSFDELDDDAPHDSHHDLFVTANGDWRIVPEPTSHLLVSWSALVVAWLSSRGRTMHGTRS